MAASKRIFLKAVFFLLAMTLALPGLYAAENGAVLRQDSGAKAPDTIGDAFIDEELVYQIGFWVFDDVAIGKVSLKEADNGEYTATLIAYTTGMIDKVVTRRRDTYISRLKIADGGKRFITVSFDKTVEMRGKTRRTLTLIDYGKRLMTWTGWKDGVEDRKGEIKIPPDIYSDDPLCAFYNMRFGVYGPISEGKEFKIMTFPKEDHVPEIYMRVATREEMERRAPGKNPAADYLADVKIDPELFAAGGGIEILFSSDLVPVEAVAKDVALFGDVRGRLKSMGLSMGFKKTRTAE